MRLNCSRCLLTLVLATIAGASDLSSRVRSHPSSCLDNNPKQDWPQAAAIPLPALVRQAIALLPFIEERQVVILSRPSDVSLYLVSWGYARKTASETVEELSTLAEFTIDHHFPIFINAVSPHYRRIFESWERGTSPDQAARVLASDIYHEYRHAVCQEEEADALAAQISLLKRWRAEGLLQIADQYIADKESERRSLAAKHANVR